MNNFTSDELQLLKDALETCWHEWAQYDVWRTDLYRSALDKILNLQGLHPSMKGEENGV